MEIAVLDYFGVRCECSVAVNVCLVCCKFLALYGECGNVKYMKCSSCELCLYFVDLFLRAFSRNCGVQLCEDNCVVGDALAVIFFDSRSVLNCGDDVLEVGLP